MTANQIAYWNMRENERSNRANEAETNRSNVTRERETERSNRAKEAENYRHNFATEGETERHNKRTEAQTDTKLAEDGRHNRVLEYWQGFSEQEKQRHNIKLEGLQSEGNQIQWFNAIAGDRHNKMEEDLKARDLAEREAANKRNAAIAQQNADTQEMKMRYEHNDRARELVTKEKDASTREFLSTYQARSLDSQADLNAANAAEVPKMSERQEQYLADTKSKTELAWEQYYWNQNVDRAKVDASIINAGIGALGNLASSALGGGFNLAGQMYNADQSYLGSRYSADMNYAGRVYSSDNNARRYYE